MPGAEYVAPLASGRICLTMLTHSISELASPRPSSVPPVPSPVSYVQSDISPGNRHVCQAAESFGPVIPYSA